MDTDKYIRTQAHATWAIVVFTVVLAAVGIQQCYILREADRPVIMTAFDVAEGYLPRTGEKMKVDLGLINSGRTATLAYVRSTIVYSLEAIDSPPLPTTENRQPVWPSGASSTSIVFIKSPQEITEGQLSDMRNGRGYVYVSAYIRYGKKGQYHTAICSEYKVQKTANGPVLFGRDSGGLCKDPDSNSTN